MPLFGCVSIDDEIMVGLKRTENTWIISIAEPSGVEFNAHSFIWTNGMKRYEITVPKKGFKIDRGSIFLSTAFIGAGTPQKIEIDKSSTIRFNKCNVHIVLFNINKKPLSFNGVYDLPTWYCNKVT